MFKDDGSPLTLLELFGEESAIPAGAKTILEGESIEDNASWWQYIWMSYLDPILKVGNVRTLDMDDVGAPSNQDRSFELRKKFDHYYAEEKKRPLHERSLWRVLWATVGFYKFIIAFSLFGMYAALQYGPVMCLERLVKHLSGAAHYSDVGLWVMVGLLFLLPALAGIFYAHSNAYMAHLGSQFRNIIITVLYRKSLTISPYQKQSISTGRILTMFSEDTNQLKMFMIYCCNSLCSPLQIGVSTYLIYEQVGVSTFVGFGYLVLTLPITVLTFASIAYFRVKKMKETDFRVKLMNEVLNGIRIIKYYAWEGAFVSKVTGIRNSEVETLSIMGYIFAVIFSMLMLSTSQVLTVLIFYTYIALDNVLDSAKSFTTLSLFGLLTSPFIFLPFGLQQFVQCRIAINRLLEFLDAENIVDYAERPEKIVDNDGNDIIIEMKNACFSWSPEGVLNVPEESTEGAARNSVTPVSEQEHSVYTLENVNLSIKKGELVGIVGSVGSGKSSMLSAVLGEMYLRSGTISIAGNPTIAFCDQRPWILNSTVKGNVIFGEAYDEARMERALFQSALVNDLKIMDDGLMTEIGDKGVNLSGGQKARVSLARAVYNDADLILFDDPLSAVDAHVGEHIFTQCIRNGLEGKTRLFVTNQVHVLSQCDRIVILDGKGRVLITGTYDEIIASGIDVSQYLPSSANEEKEEEENKEAEKRDAGEPTSSRDQPVSTRSRSKSTVSKKDLEEAADEKKDHKALVTKEVRNEGNVSMEIYMRYFGYGGIFATILMVTAQLAANGLNLWGSMWLSDWGEEVIKKIYYRNEDMSNERNMYWFHGYAGIQMGSLALTSISKVVQNYHRTNVSYSIHKDLLSQVIYLPVAFFDVTPLGRIINRFSQDMATIDDDISQSVSQVLGTGAACLGCVAGIIASTNGSFAALVFPVAVLYYFANAYFRRSNTAIARLESVTRSPIYADFQAGLAGASTIRAYKVQSRFINRLQLQADINIAPGVLQQLLAQWLSMRLDMMGAFITGAIGILAVASRNTNFMPAGYVGMSLSYAIQLTSMMKMTVRMAAQMEAQFNSFERAVEYIDNTRTEAETQNDNLIAAKTGNLTGKEEGFVPVKELVTPPASWPEHGVVEFRNAKMRYRDGPLVLKGVNFVANGCDKVGIAGRTGCGKSSLMVALFRIEELAAGQIFIDGVDIASIPTSLLRSKLCIIPQDPVMFSATVRFNVDPFDEFTDAQVWDVLEAVNMKDFVNSLPGKLEELVAEGGDNFSAGQRQLICIARAILRKPKILIMDEATASIDKETDAFIQSMIRTKFSDCTILTIAHRLNTIIDSTRILIMEGGVVGEYDTPETLLHKEGGIFKALWDKHIKEGGESGI